MNWAKHAAEMVLEDADPAAEKDGPSWKDILLALGGIGAIGAAGYAGYKNWDAIKGGLGDTRGGLQRAWDKVPSWGPAAAAGAVAGASSAGRGGGLTNWGRITSIADLQKELLASGGNPKNTAKTPAAETAQDLVRHVGEHAPQKPQNGGTTLTGPALARELGGSAMQGAIGAGAADAVRTPGIKGWMSRAYGSAQRHPVVSKVLGSIPTGQLVPGLGARAGELELTADRLEATSRAAAGAPGGSAATAQDRLARRVIGVPGSVHGRAPDIVSSVAGGLRDVQRNSRAAGGKTTRSLVGAGLGVGAHALTAPLFGDE